MQSLKGGMAAGKISHLELEQSGQSGHRQQTVLSQHWVINLLQVFGQGNGGVWVWLWPAEIYTLACPLHVMLSPAF